MSGSVDAYTHPEKPYALVAYSSASQQLALALCSDLRSYGFQLAAISLDGADHGVLKGALGDKSDEEVSYFSPQAEDVEAGLQVLSKHLASKNVTLSVNCVDSKWWKMVDVDDEEKPNVSGVGYEPHGFFVGVQRMVLPHLIRNSPAVLLAISDTCVPSFNPSKAALAKFLESFTFALSREISTQGHESMHVAHMDYYTKQSSDYSPHEGTLTASDASMLSSNILRMSSREVLHVSPIWSQQILSWVVWLLLWILPQNVVRKLV